MDFLFFSVVNFKILSQFSFVTFNKKKQHFVRS